MSATLHRPRNQTTGSALKEPLVRSAIGRTGSFDGLSAGQGSSDDEGESGGSAPRRKLLASLREFFADAKDAVWSSDQTSFYAPRGTGKRLLPRDYPFHQCSGKLNIAISMCKDARRLFSYDMFHVLVQAPTSLLLALVVGTYTTVVFFFTCIYLVTDRTDDTCHLGISDAPLTWHTAFAFAVETQATIGYGIPSEAGAYFSGCPTLPIIVFCHSLMVWILNASLVASTLARISRANLRAVEVVFSDKACVQCTRGAFYLRFQVAELSLFRYHPAVEAHVRCYAVLHEKDSANSLQCPFQTRAMRLLHPDDTRGGMLFLPVPSTIMHAVDEWSPLYPPLLARHRRRKEAQLDLSHPAAQALHRYPHLTGYSFPGVQQRAADLETMEAVRVLAEAQRESQPGGLRKGAGGQGGHSSGDVAPNGAATQQAGASASPASSPSLTRARGGGSTSPSALSNTPPSMQRGASELRNAHEFENALGTALRPSKTVQPAMSRVGSAVALDQLGFSRIGGPVLHCGRDSEREGEEAARRFQLELRAHVARSDVEIGTY